MKESEVEVDDTSLVKPRWKGKGKAMVDEEGEAKVQGGKESQGGRT